MASSADTPNPETPKDDWMIFEGNKPKPDFEVGGDNDPVKRLPNAPSWRPFGEGTHDRRKRRGETFETRPEEVKMINAALYLRRPLLITGKPGTGKSSIAYAVAQELKLGEVLYWPITTRTTLKNGLYTYDAIGRLQEAKRLESPGGKPVAEEEPQTVAKYITLGPLGTALLQSGRPRVLLIDEIDKSDIDLPNDLLTIFEEGRFDIPELLRLEKDDPERPGRTIPVPVNVRTAYTDDEDSVTGKDCKLEIPGGRITCEEFPLVILTSNGERDFPPPFLRRCLRLNMYEPDEKHLAKIIQRHFRKSDGSCSVPEAQMKEWIKTFLDKQQKGTKEQLATDQLLNALFMVTQGRPTVETSMKEFVKRFILAGIDRDLPPPEKPTKPDKSEPK